MRVNRVGATATAVAIVLVMVPGLADGGPLYRVTDLGTLGGNQSFALDVNNRGQVSGNARTSSTTLPLLAYLGDAGTMRNLGAIPGSNDFSRAYALNDHGVVVGESDNGALRAT